MLFQPTIAVLCVRRPLPKPLPRSGRGFNTGFTFRRHHPIEFYIADFYCPNLRLVIEIDGEIRAEKGIQKYDEGRTGELERFGIKVIRYISNQILHDSNLVLEKINALIKELTTTS
jgi:very-short-patch-repair endonuclease